MAGSARGAAHPPPHCSAHLAAPPPLRSALADNAYQAMAAFFCERRGFSSAAALSPTGPVAALLAGARSHLQQPKQLLLGRLAGLVPSGRSGSSRSLQHPAAWQFFVRLLCCLRALQGAGWEGLVRDWVDREEGVPLPLPCVLDTLANLYNTGEQHSGWGGGDGGYCCGAHCASKLYNQPGLPLPLQTRRRCWTRCGTRCCRWCARRDAGRRWTWTRSCWSACRSTAMLGWQGRGAERRLWCIPCSPTPSIDHHAPACAALPNTPCCLTRRELPHQPTGAAASPHGWRRGQRRLCGRWQLPSGPRQHGVECCGCGGRLGCLSGQQRCGGSRRQTAAAAQPHAAAHRQPDGGSRCPDGGSSRWGAAAAGPAQPVCSSAEWHAGARS